MNDKELVSRMQHGDMQAFDELYERYKDDAYRLACLITGSRTDGEDLAQEAFVTCAQSIKSLRDGSKFRPWLLKTLSRAAWKYCRKAKRETPVSEFFDAGESESALSAVLQLAVTMDYSIFLWHSYNEQRAIYPDKCEAMAHAISATLTSVVGSSITTIAGFLALCFMSFTLGRDLGIVMAKGVLLGVLSCVTVLPSLILLLDKPLQKTRHRSILPKMDGLAKGVTKVFPLFLALFVVLAPVFYFAYDKTNDEVYYDMGQCLPEDMEYVIANSKLSEEFDIASTHMLLVDASLPSKQVRSMISDMEQVDGVKYVLGLESVVGAGVPEEILPDSVRSILKSDKWELLLINSEYKVASDEVNAQIDSLNAILKKYDPTGMLIGEAPCMKDMIETTDHDFKVVNAVSILAIFLIILLVERSISLPFLLIAVIELAIFINLGLPHFLGQSLPFIAPICISTIQLGATVDIDHGYVRATAQRLKGAHIVTDMVTVTGTENLVMAAVLAEGETVIENAAREPEVVDLCDCLNAMGAHITGAGTPVISIEGVERLHGAEHTVIADRIEAGSFLVAGVVTQGDVLVTHCQPSQMEVVLDKLRATGAVLDIGADWVRVRMTGRPKPVSIRTVPHPGFPTDMQAQFMTLNCFAEGTANITETIFENRFMHVPELCRMGAHITIEGHTAIVEGVAQLTGTTIMATDLRASASLVIAALAAQGSSTVDRIYHLDRGYERMEEKLRALGADIVRIDV